MPEKAKKIRKRGPNVQTGCVTCKIRRKKCDVTRPACIQCSSTGRTCDFLPQSTENRALQARSAEISDTEKLCFPLKLPLPYYGPIISPAYLAPLPISAEDVPHFDYFRIACTEEFSCFFNAPLWKQLILQAAYAEPFMLHAVLAIGALRRSQLTPFSSGSATAMPRYSIEQYGIASRGLAEILNGDAVDWKMALLGSLVFLAMEVLRGHEPSALLHFRSGSSILRSLAIDGYHPTRAALSSSKSSSSGNGVAGEFDDIVTAFTRLSVEQYPFVGLHGSDSNSTFILPSHFSTLTEARCSLNSIVALMHASFRQFGGLSYRTLPADPLPHLAKLHDIQTSLGSWLQKLNMFLSTAPSTSEIDIGTKALQIQHLVAYIRTSTFFSTTQLIYDTHLSTFSQIVSMTEKIVDSDNLSWPKSNGPCFTLDIAMAQPLYFVVRYCRCGVVRRRAIEVLRRVGRDGVYSGRTVAKIAEWIMRIEEGHSEGGFVDEERRLCDISFDIREDGRTAAVCAVRKTLDGIREEVYNEIVLSI